MERWRCQTYYEYNCTHVPSLPLAFQDKLVCFLGVNPSPSTKLSDGELLITRHSHRIALHQPYEVPTAGTQASSLGKRMGHIPPRGPGADWWMPHVFEFLVLGHAGFLTMFSFTVLRVVVMKSITQSNAPARLAGFESVIYNSYVGAVTTRPPLLHLTYGD
ncbi:hypothetical protein PYW08_012792 [Mythimna loreyi]|uniref:Uncharacterized protein n=1 Tax=Mythimna loreyi TaxID=667449 RepID=A0ACC2Q2E6_9NEOP|nr:hypothetical protein PYW08_012792 [Mythimna loreyi]